MSETETILTEAATLTEGRGAIAAIRALPAGAQLRAAKTLLAGLRRRAQVPQDAPTMRELSQSGVRAAQRRLARTIITLPSGLEALNRGPLGACK